MKILFLSITTGYGHHMCANSVMDYLTEHDVECRMLDAFKYVNPLLGASVARGYLLSTHYAPNIYSKFYRLAETRRRKSKKFLSSYRMTHSLFSKKLVTYIDNYKPDVIVCTHVFAAQMITEMKVVKAKTIGIVTDFTIHPYWEETKLDYYVSASELLNYQFQKKGVPLEKVLPIGIPIKTKFANKISKDEARKILKIEDKYTVLIMGGSMGFGNITHMIRRLDRLDMDFQIVAICGNNKSMKRQLGRLKTSKKLYSYGFVNNVEVIMDAVDCICTKPGGLTTSEALAKRLPMLIPAAIPGQEERNMEFLLNNGIGMRATSTCGIDECLYQLMMNQKMGDNIKMGSLEYLAKPNAAKDLGDFIIEELTREGGKV